ncbi:hypothetical protein [Streptomyces mirabilis]|uniref:hypothetical protein n=1 Tax=Streptomyces mirabilis TaxID=68239 RepID=UPI003251F5AD
MRRDHGSNWFMVLASYVRTWPSDLQDEWPDYLTSQPNDLDLAPAKDTAVTEAPGSYWKRYRTEIIWALIFGVVIGVILSPLGAIAYEAFTAWMHHRGVYWNWETPGAEA